MNINDSALDEPLRGHVEWLRRRHGLNQTGALLAALIPVLAATGASRRILSPIDYSFIPGAMSVVLVGAAVHIQAAVNLGLEPIRQWITQSTEPIRKVRLRIADLHQDLSRNHILTHSAVPTGLGSMTDEELEARRHTFVAERESILQRINAESFRVAPFIITDDAPIRKLLEPGKLSHDGAVLNASQGHVVAVWTQASRAEKVGLARILSNSWHGLSVPEQCMRPLLSTVIVTNPAGADTLASDRALQDTGVNNQLHYVNALAVDAATDLTAVCDDETAEQWTTGLQALLNTRLAGVVTDYRLQQDSVARFQSFLNSSIAAGHESATVLALKLALLLHCASPAYEDEDSCIPDRTVKAAITLAESIHSNCKFMPTAPAATNDLDALVAKLNLRGPMPWRKLLRVSGAQKSAPLVTLLKTGITAGVIVKDGDNYASASPRHEPANSTKAPDAYRS